MCEYTLKPAEYAYGQALYVDDRVERVRRRSISLFYSEGAGNDP